jgi:hypothetical protein
VTIDETMVKYKGTYLPGEAIYAQEANQVGLEGMVYG